MERLYQKFSGSRWILLQIKLRGRIILVQRTSTKRARACFCLYVDSTLTLSRSQRNYKERWFLCIFRSGRSAGALILLRFSKFRPGSQAKYAKYFASSGRVLKPRAIFSPRGDAATTAKTASVAIISACVIN